MKTRSTALRVAVCLLALFAHALYAQDSLNVTKIGQLPFWDYAMDAKATADFVCVAAWSSGLRMVNIPRTGAPREVGAFNPPGILARSVSLAGDYAYVGDVLHGMWVLNINNPSAPFLISRFDTALSVNAVALVGNFAYVASNHGLRVVNIADPAAPQEVFAYDTTCVVTDVKTSDENAYVLYDACDFKILNTGNPAVPVEVGSLPISGGGRHLAIAGNLALITSNSGSDLFILNITNSDNPLLVGSLSGLYEVWDVIVKDTIAYLSGGIPSEEGEDFSWLRMVNIANPSAPVWASTFLMPKPGLGKGMDLIGNTLYVADNQGGLRILDITGRTAPSQIAVLDQPELVDDIQIVGNYAYLAAEMRGLRVLDLSNPAAPFEVGAYDIWGENSYATSVAVDNGYAYIAAEYDGFVILDVHDPTAPAIVSHMDAFGWGTAVAARDNLVYLADGQHSSLRVLDVSNPAEPVQLDSIPAFSRIRKIRLYGHYAYVTIASLQGTALAIYDLAVPQHPALVGSFTSIYGATDVVVENSIAYLAASNDGLEILDVSDPAHPALRETFSTPGAGYCLLKQSNRIFGGFSDFRVIDVTNIGNPSVVGYYSGSEIFSVAAFGDYICASDRYGISIYRYGEANGVTPPPVAQPMQFVLDAAYPNPFNPTSTITFSVPIASQIKLQVFDILGRQADGLLSAPTGVVQPGIYHVTFDGSSLSSGVYFVRMTAGDFSTQQKLVLLK